MGVYLHWFCLQYRGLDEFSHPLRRYTILLGMVQSGTGVHVVTTERTYKGKRYRTPLLRRSYREAGQVKKKTVANITGLGDEIVQLIRQALQGQKLGLAEDAFKVINSWHHGHVQAVLEAMRRLGFERLLGVRACRERPLVMGLVATRIIEPQSKLATARSWSDTTLAQQLEVEKVSESELYAALDWLGKRQSRIERRLTRRHLATGEWVLYDLSSSYFEGRCCPLAAYGYNRDGKWGKLQVNYGVLANAAGYPVVAAVVSGNVDDPTTLLPQVQVLRERFEIEGGGVGRGSRDDHPGSDRHVMHVRGAGMDYGATQPGDSQVNTRGRDHARAFRATGMV
jgi:hypothetical protein